jgi:hypothetical protein
MDTLHSVLRTIRTETESGRDHLSVFREFLAHLDAIQRKAMDRPRIKVPARRRPLKRVEG